MIRLRCDNCERPIDAQDDQVGTKIRCPYCGDVNLVPGNARPASPANPPKTDRAAAAGHPPADGPEQTVLSTRTAMFRAHPFQFAGCLLLIIAGLITGFAAGLVTPLAVAGWVAATLAALYLITWRIAVLGSALTITNKRVIERRGFFSKSTSEVAHRDIRNIQVAQSFFERLMGTGRLSISSSGQDGMEIELRDIPRPYRVRELIDLYRPL